MHRQQQLYTAPLSFLYDTVFYTTQLRFSYNTGFIRHSSFLAVGCETS